MSFDRFKVFELRFPKYLERPRAIPVELPRLFDAILEGKLPRGAYPRSMLKMVDPFGRTALHMAIIADQWDLFKQLLMDGIDPNFPTRTSTTDTFLVERYVDRFETEIVPELQHENIGDSGVGHLSPLLLALSRDPIPRVEVFRQLLQSRARVDIYTEPFPDLDGTRSVGWQALHIATAKVAQGAASTELLKLLLDHGADTAARGTNGTRPIHIAAFYKSIETVQVLVDYSADPDLADDLKRNVINYAACWPSQHSWTIRTVPDQMTIARRREELLRFLHGCGCANKARSPIHTLNLDNHFASVVRLLIEQGYGIDDPDEEGFTPLWRAALEESPSLRHELIRLGANRNASPPADWQGEPLTALLSGSLPPEASRLPG